MITKRITLAAIALMAAGVANANTLKIATTAPAGTPWVAHLEASSAAISAASGGDMKFEIFPGSQLGSETDVIKQVSSGRLDGGVFSTSASSLVVPEVGLVTMPMFWESYAQVECAMDNHLGPLLTPMFEARGLKIIQWQELGWTNVFSKKPVSTPADVAGVKFRISQVESNDIFGRAIGVSGVPMGFSDIAASLETGLIDAGETPTIVYVASGLGKIAPYLTNTQHNYQPSIMLLSLKTWNGFSEEEKKLFNENMATADANRKAVRGAVAFFENKLVEGGGTVKNLTPEERAEWASKFTPEMTQEILDNIGGQAETVYAAMVAARDACSN